VPTKKVVVKKSTPEKQGDMLNILTGQCKSALSKLKDQLGEKKFEKRIKKISKLLTKGLKKEPVKKSAVAAKKTQVVVKKAIKTVIKK
jgi:hypothetical protein